MHTQQDLDEMLDHVGYEWWMFRATYARLAEIDEEGDVILNALVESLAIHGRGLIAFFYEASANEKKTDVTFEHYSKTPRPALPKTGDPDDVVLTWKQATDWRIAHVTSYRLSRWQGWPTQALYAVLAPKIDQLRKLVGGKLPHDDDRVETVHSLKTKSKPATNLTTQSASVDPTPFLAPTSSTKGVPGVFGVGSMPASTTGATGAAPKK